MKVAVFSARKYDRELFTHANTAHDHALSFFDVRLTADTAALAAGYPAICVFVNDAVDGRDAGNPARGRHAAGGHALYGL